MRKSVSVIIAIAAILMPAAVHAQKAKLKVAQGYYNQFDFSNAMIIYQDVLSSPKHAQDTTALRMLADCEVRTGQYAKAEGHLKMLMDTPAVKTKDLHQLAEVLKIQGKYEEAVGIYQKILFKDPNDQVAARYAMVPDFAVPIMKDSALYVIKEAKNINSSASDFAPGFFVQGKLIFSSSRGMGIGAARSYNWNQQPYLNIFLADIASDSTLNNANVMGTEVNSRYHEGTISYYPSSNKMFLTRNNFVKGNVRKSKEGRLNLAIYTTEYSNGVWGKLTPFEFNNPEYSVGHPTLTASGNKIYFASDKPGGTGGTDIYYCEKQGEKWSEPINAGPAINTQGDELFPFAVGDSALYFSSNGWLGLGGLDMYYIHFTTADSSAKNLGYPANSRYDDFGVIVYPSEDGGYFCSNRPGGTGDDDIYEFRLIPPVAVDIEGRVVEKGTLKPLSDARVFVPAPDGSVVEAKTNNKGEYSLKAPYSKVIRINAEKKDYESNGIDLPTNPRITYYKANDIELSKEAIVAKGRVIYDADGSPAPGAMIRLLDAKGIVLDSTFAQADGSYKLPLPESQKVTIEVTKNDYVKLTDEVDTGKLPKRFYEKDFRLFKLEKGTVVRLDNIYYDYGKADIRPDAALELNKLVQILKDNPTIKIELSSHTDSRGGDAYNLNLSDKRAKSAVSYIIGQGIQSNRMVAKGYGETKLLNRCANDVKCSEEEHQFNRRTEFKILDI
ncbi:MAG: OmpA family protein [Crocinitomicaceae bacterium]|nr:OmpA family protein [Crocinitomicaceae bacterium]